MNEHLDTFELALKEAQLSDPEYYYSEEYIDPNDTDDDTNSDYGC